MKSRQTSNIVPPCKYCEKKGCGSYHDKCKDYQKYKKELEKMHKKFGEYYYRYFY